MRATAGRFCSPIGFRFRTVVGASGPQSGPYEAGCESFDFDGDGSVSLLDFSGFQRVFAP